MDSLFRTILAATDGSATGERAVSFAAALAREHGATLLLCTAVDRTAALASCSSPYGFEAGRIFDALDASAAEVLCLARGSAARGGVGAASSVLYGPPADAIVRFAAAQHADAVVIGANGAGSAARFFLGSTAEGVLRQTDVPVFVVPEAASCAARAACVLVAVDDSESSEPPFGFALRLAEATPAIRLVLCSVADTRDLFEKAADYGFDAMPMLNEARQRASDALAACAVIAAARGVAHELTVVNGAPAGAIVAAAQLHGAGLIVLGTHARHGLARLFKGSVAETVIRHATMPVAVVTRRAVAALTTTA